MKELTFDLYVDRFLEGTAYMTPAQVGGYFRLLLFNYKNNSLSKDDNILKALSGLNNHGDFSIVMEKFELTENGYMNKRVKSELDKKQKIREKQRVGGKKGAMIKIDKNSKSSYFNYNPLAPELGKKDENGKVVFHWIQILINDKFKFLKRVPVQLGYFECANLCSLYPKKVIEDVLESMENKYGSYKCNKLFTTLKSWCANQKK